MARQASAVDRSAVVAGKAPEQLRKLPPVPYRECPDPSWMRGARREHIGSAVDVSVHPLFSTSLDRPDDLSRPDLQPCCLILEVYSNHALTFDDSRSGLMCINARISEWPVALKTLRDAAQLVDKARSLGRGY